MVVESHGGGWSHTFRRMIDWIASSSAASSHEDPAAVSLRIAQRIACSLQRENARAILRRRVNGVEQQPHASQRLAVISTDIWQ